MPPLGVHPAAGEEHRGLGLEECVQSCQITYCGCNGSGEPVGRWPGREWVTGESLQAGQGLVEWELRAEPPAQSRGRAGTSTADSISLTLTPEPGTIRQLGR